TLALVVWYLAMEATPFPRTVPRRGALRCAHDGNAVASRAVVVERKSNCPPRVDCLRGGHRLDDGDLHRRARGAARAAALRQRRALRRTLWCAVQRTEAVFLEHTS